MKRTQALPDEPRDRFGESGSGDPLRIYLREIGQVKLLTPQEEIELAKRIRRGDKAAREHMIKANLRLVVKIARDYENAGLPLLDLISEGNIGLMKAVERFDPRKGAKLSTYGSWWIKQAIKRALANQSKTIRLPVHVVDKVSHIRRTELRLQGILDRDPTDEELAQELGLDPRNVGRYRNAAKPPVSLDAPISDSEDSGTVEEVVADENAENAAENVESGDLRRILGDRLLASLTERERDVIRRRYGLDGKEQTLEEVGGFYGVTRERIRQIQNIALKKLRKMLERHDATGSVNGLLPAA